MSVVNIIPRMTYDLTNIAPGTSLEIPIAKCVDVSGYSRAGLVVRVYSTGLSGGGSIAVFARHDAPSEAYDFESASDVASVSISGGVAFVGVGQIDNLGSHLRFGLRGTQPAEGGMGMRDLRATISVDLVLK